MTIQPVPYVLGTKISAPGIYSGVPMPVYHSQCCVGPSVSSSGLRDLFLKSAAHFWKYSSLNPNREEREETKYMALGRAAHHIFGGEEEFTKHYIVRPETYPDTKAGEPKKWTLQAGYCKDWEGKAALKGLTILTPDQAEQIRGMSAAIEAEPMARDTLRGHMELSLFWQDPVTGLWLKARPDALPFTGPDGADLKCVIGVSDREIHNTMEERGYFMQGALVGESFEKVLGVEMGSFSFIFVESEKPHCVRIESLAAEDYDRGWKANRAALRKLKRCLDTNQWPGPVNRDGQGGTFNLSKTARERIDVRIARIEQELAA
jgi:hypothetical protein